MTNIINILPNDVPLTKADIDAYEQQVLDEVTPPVYCTCCARKSEVLTLDYPDTVFGNIISNGEKLCNDCLEQRLKNVSALKKNNLSKPE